MSIEADQDCAELRERVGFPGPSTHHDVVVDGWRVPLIQAHSERRQQAKER
jgi:hypothetical protein